MNKSLPANASSKGSSWNESETYRDAISLRRVRKLTSKGYYNTTPTYHTGAAFTPDGRYVIFASGREWGSALFCANTASGDLIQLTDWHPDHGSLEELHKSGNNTCIRGGGGHGVSMLAGTWGNDSVVFVQGRSVKAVHIPSLEERLLLASFGDDWICGTPSVCGKDNTILLPLMSAHPELAAGGTAERSYFDRFRETGPSFRLLKISLSSGESSVVYEEHGVGCAHCPHSPAGADMVLIDRDRPPSLWCGGDGQTNRIWTLHLPDGDLTEMRCCSPQHFQTHSAWAWDGSAILYHGPDGRGGGFIGAVSPSGSIIKEYAFPVITSYGHVSALAGRKAILLDGDITPDLLLALDYDHDQPRIEILGRHSSDITGMPWQYAHVHPQSDSQGSRIVFNSCRDGRSDVFLLDL